MILASEALRSEQINMASGEAEAILVRATATARGIDAVAESLQGGGEAARGAVSLTVEEEYVDAVGNLAKTGTSVVVPSNMGDMGGMIASAMAMYGKINEGQAKSMAAGFVSGGSDKNAAGNLQGPAEKAHKLNVGKQDEVARSVLDGFEQTTKRR